MVGNSKGENYKIGQPCLSFRFKCGCITYKILKQGDLKYKDLEKILKILQEIPNEKKRDEAIRLILQTANDTITCEVLLSMLSNGRIQKEQTIKQWDETLFLKFTNKEISNMPERFRKEFILQDRVVHCLKRKSGKRTYNYMIRYRRNGLNIVATSNDLQEAKAKFIQKLNECSNENIGKSSRSKMVNGVSTNFHEFSTYYFENYRKRKVAPQTYLNDACRYKNHVRPYLGNKSLLDITPMDCQQLLDSLLEKGMSKTNNEIYSLLNGIFKMAIAHNIIAQNPLSIVVIEKHHCKHGKALTKAEEKELLNQSKGTKYEKIFALALYTGLRPNELETAKVQGEFIVARNSKRKGGKIEYKKIPISPMLKPYFEEDMGIEMIGLQYVREQFNKILPNHILYDLRTTFYTRCEECGVAPPARDHFVGHSSSVLNATYTDLSDEYLLKEGKKLVW